MKIHFATWLYEPSQGEALTNRNAFNRLLSYYFLVNGGVNKLALNKYVKTGKNSKK